ncbi:hypothetical protein [Lutispora saccharofermentans]|uniref:Uncharacterized protein n=1 Tax=Lutispora saccharofermentans TaxID=3024236 RepID=A0ABT1NE59_9FIRM|nr:hypothetical protein [Lutispora saccharofermentans]MCQ1529520.1 hypothetical protein [Lutispora saccharofermentans]
MSPVCKAGGIEGRIGRTASVFCAGQRPGLLDVLRDSGGAILGMGIYRLGLMIKPARKYY